VNSGGCTVLSNRMLGNDGGGKKRKIMKKKKYVVHERYNADGFFEAEKNKRTTQV